MKKRGCVFRGLALLSGLVPILILPSCLFFCWFTVQSPAQGKESSPTAWVTGSVATDRSVEALQDFLAYHAPVSETPEQPARRTLLVRATAYNAVEAQTDSDPLICAWGDRIRPGTIAVSQDLEKLGLTRGQVVHVEGRGKLVVLDRMHPSKTNQIDIYMSSYKDALRFGVRRLEISWVSKLARADSKRGDGEA